MGEPKLRGFVTRAWLGALGLMLVACGGSTGVSDGPSPATSHQPDVPRAVAESFIAYAQGAGVDVPWAESTIYTIGNSRVAKIHRGEGLPDILASCLPGATKVDSHRCPVSPLEVIKKTDGALEITDSLPDHVGCNKYVGPDTTTNTSVIIISPPESQRNCFDDFVVALTVDEVGKVTAVDLALSGP